MKEYDQFDLLDILKKERKWMTRNELLKYLKRPKEPTECKKLNRKLRQLIDFNFVFYEKINTKVPPYNEYRFKYKTANRKFDCDN
jgi:predicted transcriptional regulator